MSKQRKPYGQYDYARADRDWRDFSGQDTAPIGRYGFEAMRAMPAVWEVQDAAAAVVTAEKRLRAAVKAARAAALGWDEIGLAAGIKSDAARYRWGRGPGAEGIERPRRPARPDPRPSNHGGHRSAFEREGRVVDAAGMAALAVELFAREREAEGTEGNGHGS